MDDTTRLTPCPQCGTDLPADTAEGLCPVCLFAAAAGPLAADALTSHSDSGVRPARPPRLTPGQGFGPYRIGRLLGRGGMGDVYEAQHMEQGRRVAVKVLNRRLGEVERTRFVREGQLAASINHPHSVYIFGSEEIDGTPAIAMELLPGGTLKDLVRQRGPLPPAEAVDTILQVIAGLDALHAVGVLHRDIKPGNCFVDRDGAVKVGDFGLSISTLGHDMSQLTAVGTFHGTPQYAAPEQLKGEPMDVRSDIYAVGATLYYLLTGRPPFAETNLLVLLSRVVAEPAPSPRTFVPRVPRGLAKIVLRCLEKDRTRRPATYAALHDALRPFSSAVPTPATIGMRSIAGAIDAAILWFPSAALAARFANDQSSTPWWAVLDILAWVAYFGILERVWGASIGKAVVGLRVVTASGNQPPGVGRTLGRATILFAPHLLSALFLDQTGMLQVGSSFMSSLWGWRLSGIGPPRTVPTRVLIGRGDVTRVIQVGPPLMSTALLVWELAKIALMFSTMRRRNGFAGVHELWSGTRVVQRTTEKPHPSLDATVERTTGVDGSRRLGPFDVVGTLGRTEIGTLLVGFDSRLRRRVWLHELPVGTPSVAPLVRDLDRPARLRWLDERRSSTERWDAYEALDGTPLIALLDRPRTWRDVRQWLADLAAEIDAGLGDGSLGCLALDRVWITRAGRAKLLDFQVPDAPRGSHETPPASAESAQGFLSDLAASALTGDPGGESAARGQQPRHTLPVSATALLDALERRSVESWSDVVRRTAALANAPYRVERWARATSLGVAAAIPLGMVLMTGAFLTTEGTPVARPAAAEIDQLSKLLNTLSSVELRYGEPGVPRIDRTALETYIVGRFGATMRDPQVWADRRNERFLERHRYRVERILAKHPRVSPDQMAAATVAVGPLLAPGEQSRLPDPWALALTGVPTLLTVATVAFLASAWLFRGGLLLRALNIAVVTRDGEPVSRSRALWRALASWGVVIAPLAAVGLGGRSIIGNEILAGLGVFLLGATAWAVVSPDRGLQDRIAGTYLVPR